MMIGLLDCNNFYVSCERLFNPKLFKKPVIVLSNNDGCVISRSEEAKKIGIKMGEPFFKIKKIIERLDINVFSSNYSLYGDISNRIMNILKNELPIVEIYSIDEAFFSLDLKFNREKFCSDLSKKILKWTGIPVSIGIAKTKTLAKVANRVIKKKECYDGLTINYQNVFELESLEITNYILKKTNVIDIWGVGNRLSLFLINNNINNAQDLRDCNSNFIRKEKGVTLERSVLELKGIVCNEIQSNLTKKKSICVSRSFGKKLYEFEDIKNALIVYVHKASFKMRTYKFFCSTVTIFLKTSKYQSKSYSNIKTYSLLEATNDIRTIWNISKKLLKQIYKSGFLYNKVGIILCDFCTLESKQKSLIDDYEECHKKKIDIKLMEVMDYINNRFGASKLRLSSDKSGSFHLKNKNRNWLMKSKYRSPCYTTNWNDIPKIKT